MRFLPVSEPSGRGARPPIHSLILSTVLAALVCSGCRPSGNGSEGRSRSQGQAMAESPDAWDGPRLDHPPAMERRLLDSVRYLASDELEGRGIGTRGIELAAEFVAQQFSEAGLDIEHFSGEPYQRFARQYQIAMNGPNELAIRCPDSSVQTLSLGREFTPLSLSGSSRFEVPVVFAGYGITATESGYDDYAEVDVTGKAALILRHAPRPGQREAPEFDKQQIQLARKVTNAVEHGAAVVLFCTDGHTLRQRAEEAGRPTEQAAQNESPRLDSLLGFRVRGEVPRRRVPVIHLQRQAVAEMIVASSAETLETIEARIDQTLQPQSRVLAGWSLSGQVTVGAVPRDLKNVIASLEGEGPSAEETIVLGAHYDHLGTGGWASLAFGSRAVHNGADDNASGTAVLMELGRQLAGRDQPLGRRIVFVAFTAEESGLVGSEYYVEHPLEPLERTVAMLNLDMVGYLRNDLLHVYGTGTAREFDPLLYRWGTAHALRLQTHAYGSGPSDHASFHQRGIPVLHFFTGFHDDYHRPGDDWEKLNIRGMRRITELARDLVIQLADAGERPRPRSSEQDMLATERSQPRGADLASQPVRLGVEGSMTDGQPGFVIQRIAKWGLADQSGFRAGDRILAIGSRRVCRLADFSQAETELQRADTVPVLVRRGTLQLEIPVTVN